MSSNLHTTNELLVLHSMLSYGMVSTDGLAGLEQCCLQQGEVQGQTAYYTKFNKHVKTRRTCLKPEPKKEAFVILQITK